MKNIYNFIVNILIFFMKNKINECIICGKPVYKKVLFCSNECYRQFDGRR
jgi:hypothetical protein